jgi:hypothetical protein
MTASRAKHSGAGDEETVRRNVGSAVLTWRAMKSAFRLVFVAACLAGAQAARADESFRCGKWVITSALTLGEIESKCGPPASRISRTEDIRARNRNTGLLMKMGETTIETLTWDRGPRAAAMVVTVVDGTLKSIERKP